MKTITPGRRSIAPQPSVIVNNPWEKRWLKFRVLAQMLAVGRQRLGGIRPALFALQAMRRKYRDVFGEPLITKVAKVNGRYYWRLAAPGFPSAASRKMHENEVNHICPFRRELGLRIAFVAITKKCPMRCAHCFEGDNLNRKERLSEEELVAIVHKLQDYHTTQIMLSGGEPMVRLRAVFRILEEARPGTDFWLSTSGFLLDEQKARQLKAAGLTGAMISLDHYLAAEHDRFRELDGAFDAAIRAVLAAKAAGLVVTLSLCPTRQFTNRDNLIRYLDLACGLGVAFVQFVEPRAAGRFAGQEVELPPEQLQLLEAFYHRYNADPAYADHPIINYQGYHQRRLGCFGAGNRFLYVDTDGDAQRCPFCRGKVASMLEFPMEDIVRLLQEEGCQAFDTIRPEFYETA